MTTSFRRTSILMLAVLLLGETFAQEAASTDFFDKIKTYDLSTILAADSIVAEEEGVKFKQSEILGFIGDDYQRFFIHFVSVIQNPTNPYEYLVFGKTKVKENICSFQGTITVKQSRIYEASDIPAYRQGFANCEVILYEDKKQPSTGSIKGTLKSQFLIDNKGQFRYDAIAFGADGFSNNQFMGSWTSYKTKKSKKCHWGDYRIPESGDLDIGAAQFSVDSRYLKNGWENYKLAWGTYSEIPEVIKARKKEDEQWWK